MNWKSIRLELARTSDFPEGSASRAFLLHLPLDEGGLIDERSLGNAPAKATVRRFWPNEPDQTGHLIRHGRAWVFSYAVGDEDDERLYRLEDHPLRIGDYVTLTEPDGSRFPFRVVRSQSDRVNGV